MSTYSKMMERREAELFVTQDEYWVLARQTVVFTQVTLQVGSLLVETSRPSAGSL